jgi:hypothetical protein
MGELLPLQGKTSVVTLNRGGIETEREMLRNAIRAKIEWRENAIEDYEFYFGKQWSNADVNLLRQEKRPYITINRIKPLINLLSGYQRLNRYEPDFLPRTPDDISLCQLRKGLTKFVFDTTSFERTESRVFLDSLICGRGYFSVEYEWEQDNLDGNICISRCSPFELFPDPESKEPDHSDARYWARARWISKDRVIAAFPENKEEIDFMTRAYDSGEEDCEFLSDGEGIWYEVDTHKIRLVEIWEEQHERRSSYLLSDGRIVDRKDMKPEWMSIVVREIKVPRTDIVTTAFVGDVKLENGDSPYHHNMFPFVPLNAFFLGENDEPTGIVRDLKDSQREENKRRSQIAHILNNQANSGWIADEKALDEQQERNLKKFGNSPGVLIKKKQGLALTRIDPGQFPANLEAMEQICKQDMMELSGINPEMLGVDVPASSSGRAIELKQRQAVTQIAPLFDNLRDAKREILKRMWGTRGRQGLIQQYYSEEKTFRITSPSGKPTFVTVNQQVQQQDPSTGQLIMKTLNDLSVGEFDIVVTDTPATATQRLASFYQLIDAANSGIAIPPEVMLEATDLPQKEEIKQMMQEGKQQQLQLNAAAEADAKAKMWKQQIMPSLEKKLPALNYRDLPDDGKVQVAKQWGVTLTPPLFDESKVIENLSYKDLPLDMQQQLLQRVGLMQGFQPSGASSNPASPQPGSQGTLPPFLPNAGPSPNAGVVAPPQYVPSQPHAGGAGGINPEALMAALSDIWRGRQAGVNLPGVAEPNGRILGNVTRADVIRQQGPAI